MPELTFESVLRALQTDGIVRGRAGETRLDELVRAAWSNAATLDELAAHLRRVVDEPLSATAWRALHVLVGQLEIVDPLLGEKIEGLLVGGIVEGEAAIWAGHCVRLLGGAISDAALSKIASSANIAPVAWFSLIKATQSRRSVDKAFLWIAEQCTLDLAQHVDVVRYYKRWATDNRFDWNATVSRFLDLLASDRAREISGVLVDVIGSSFATEIAAFLPDARNSRLSDDVYLHIERVVAQIARSHERALEPQLEAA